MTTCYSNNPKHKFILLSFLPLTFFFKTEKSGFCYLEYIYLSKNKINSCRIVKMKNLCCKSFHTTLHMAGFLGPVSHAYFTCKCPTIAQLSPHPPTWQPHSLQHVEGCVTGHSTAAWCAKMPVRASLHVVLVKEMLLLHI